MGMCSPLLISIAPKFPGYQFIPWHFPYHLGRILVYGFLGIGIGLMGQGLNLVGFQQWTSIGLGLVILLSITFPKIRSQYSGYSAALFSLPSWFKDRFNKAFSYSFTLSAMISGALNGLLPCGLVYLALSSTLGLSGPREAFIFMSAFGLGTLPGLLAIPVLIRTAGVQKLKLPFHPSTVAGIMAGLFLIYRGLGFGLAGSPELNLQNLREAIITTCGF